MDEKVLFGTLLLALSCGKTQAEKIDLHVVDYEATVTEAGKNREVSCVRGKDKTTSADQDGTLDCATALFEYKFNLKNNVPPMNFFGLCRAARVRSSLRHSERGACRPFPLSSSPVSCFRPWSVLRPPHHAIRRNGEPI